MATVVRELSNRWPGADDVHVISRFSRTDFSGDIYAKYEPARVCQIARVITHIIEPNHIFSAILKHLSSFLTRPALQKLRIFLFLQAYQSNLAKELPDNIDHIHFVGCGWEMFGFAALAEARRRGIAFTVCPAVHPGQWGDSHLDINFYKQVDVVFALSQYEKDHLVRLGAPSNIIRVCGLAPSVNYVGNAYEFRQKHQLKNRPLVLFIGRKDRGKGYHALREAINIVSQTLPGVCLIAIGSNNEPPYPELNDANILDLGIAGDQEKADAFAACDVFCLPSTGESFGIVYVEAWSYAKPVIGGPAPAVRELITDGENGYFLNSQEPAEIASILTKCLSNKQLRYRLGANGKNLQLTKYNWDTVISRHIELFTELKNIG